MKEFTDNTEKGYMRKLFSELRRNVRCREQKERAAASNLLPLLKGNVMIYVSIGHELSTAGIIDALLCSDAVALYAPFTAGGKILPRRLKSRALPDKLGNLPEHCYYPYEDVKIDICVTPLICVNPAGYRIGYGKGCYDRFFSDSGAYKIGLCFAVQAGNFAPEQHDVALDCCVTDEKVIYF